MDRARFQAITKKYPSLRVAVLGDLCLDRYLEIDPARKEISIETGLPVHNVVNVRGQPGGAGTVLNNLSALGIGAIYPIGFVGEDGEGFELRQALEKLPGMKLDGLVHTKQRRTFTYCKPLVLKPNRAPAELNRLDLKNWTPTPRAVQEQLIERLRSLSSRLDAMVVLGQVDLPETGVITRPLLKALHQTAALHPALVILADSRSSLAAYPPVIFKMNATELGRLSGQNRRLSLLAIKKAASILAAKNGRLVFVTLAEQGIIGAAPDGAIDHCLALPTKGEIDVVGAGDAVSANVVTSLAAGASLPETLKLANAAASVVLHKLGTTGTATPREIRQCLAS